MQSWSAACGAQVSPVTATCIYDMVQLLAMFLGPLFSFYGLVDHYNEASSFLLFFFFFTNVVVVTGSTAALPLDFKTKN